MPNYAGYQYAPVDLADFVPGPRTVVVEEQFVRILPNGLIRPQQSNVLIGTVLSVGRQASADDGLCPGDVIVYAEWQGGRWLLEDQTDASGYRRCLIMDKRYVHARVLPEA